MSKRQLSNKYKVNVGRMFRIRNVKNLWFSRSGSATYSENLITKSAVDLFGQNLVTMIIDETTSRVAVYVEPYGKIWMSKHFLLKEFNASACDRATTDPLREIACSLTELYECLNAKGDNDNSEKVKVIISSLVAFSDKEKLG